MKIKFRKRRTKAALVSKSLRPKMWFHDYTRNVYASNKTCTVCGAKNLFKQRFFKAQQCSWITLGYQCKYSEHSYQEKKKVSFLQYGGHLLNHYNYIRKV